ncbi:MAG: GC-type dockerin domain-anchored protein [Phycisphaerales bacterium]
MSKTCGVVVAALAAGLSSTAPAVAQSGCSQWVMVSPATRPAPRYSHMLAFDARRGKTVLFGGNIAGGSPIPPVYANDTWEFDGTNWTHRDIPNPPPARGTGSLVFDSARGVCVLFGGQNTSGRLGDTWEYDGTAWTQRANSGPAPRVSHHMAFDSARNVTVLHAGFGGPLPVGTLLGDTWEWNGQAWSLQLPLISPLPRVSAGAAFDSLRSRFVMFAGGGAFRATAETWEYDSLSWDLRFNNVEFWRITPAMCFDSARGKSIAFGGILGNIRYADEFEWDGETWQHFDIPGPGPRSDSLMVYDSIRRRAVLFGGESSQPARLNDTWELVNLNPITITASPRSQSVMIGGSVSLSGAATGNGLTYQWRRNGIAIPGATDPSWSIKHASFADRGTYDLVVSNSCGSQATAPAVLSITLSDCPADINGDGQVNPDDLGDYIDLFFIMHGPDADFNGDGRVDPDDLGDFINQFFVGC